MSSDLFDVANWRFEFKAFGGECGAFESSIFA